MVAREDRLAQKMEHTRQAPAPSQLEHLVDYCRENGSVVNSDLFYCSHPPTFGNERLPNTEQKLLDQAEGLRGIYAAKFIPKDTLLFKHMLELQGDSMGKVVVPQKRKNKGEQMSCEPVDSKTALLSFVGAKSRAAQAQDTCKLALYEEFEKCFTEDEIAGFFGTVFTLMLEYLCFIRSNNLSSFASSSVNPYATYLSWLPVLSPTASRGIGGNDVSLDSLMCWKPEDVELCFQRTSVYLDYVDFKDVSCETYRSRFLCLTEFKSFALTVLQANKNQHAQTSLENDKLLWEFYNHAASCVQSYSFTLNLPTNGSEDLCQTQAVDEEHDSEDTETPNCLTINIMVPLMDAFNADEKLNNVRLFMREPNQQELSSRDQEVNQLTTYWLEARAIKDIKQDEQVYNCFGDMSVSDRLLKYGYVEKQDVCGLSFSPVEVLRVVGKEHQQSEAMLSNESQLRISSEEVEDFKVFEEQWRQTVELMTEEEKSSVSLLDEVIDELLEFPMVQTLYEHIVLSDEKQSDAVKHTAVRDSLGSLKQLFKQRATVLNECKQKTDKMYSLSEERCALISAVHASEISTLEALIETITFLMQLSRKCPTDS